MVEYEYDIMDRVTNIAWRTTSGATLGGFEYEYDAVGRIVSRSHAIGSNAFDRVYAYDDLDRLASDDGVTYTYRYRFQCREWSAATGLINFRMRWYDPETGRWLSKDPIGLNGGLNLYVFCDCEALNQIDPYAMSGIGFFVRPGPLLFLENGPKAAPRFNPRPVTKPSPESRPSQAMKDWNPNKPIPEGFKPPSNPKGNWYNPDTGESLHNDMGHPDPIGPHYDYIDTLKNHFRKSPDGSITPKLRGAIPGIGNPPKPPSKGGGNVEVI